MEPDIVMAVMGALIGATIGQLKGKAVTQNLSRYLRSKLQRLPWTFGKSDINDKTVS